MLTGRAARFVPVNARETRVLTRHWGGAAASPGDYFSIPPPLPRGSRRYRARTASTCGEGYPPSLGAAARTAHWRGPYRDLALLAGCWGSVGQPSASMRLGS